MQGEAEATSVHCSLSQSRSCLPRHSPIQSAVAQGTLSGLQAPYSADAEPRGAAITRASAASGICSGSSSNSKIRSAEAIVGVIGNQVQLLFDGPTTAINNAKAGKVKMLAVADRERYAVLKDVPTMTEAGVPGVDVPGGMQFFGPANMPRDVLQRVNAALAAALKEPDVVRLFVDGGTEIVASSAEEHARSVREQHERWGAVIRRLNLKLD